MAIRARVARALDSAGFAAAEWEVEEAGWSPGYRIAGIGPRGIRLYHEGPDPAHFLDAYTGELRANGFRVESEWSAPVGRHRLRVTAPGCRTFEAAAQPRVGLAVRA